MNQNDIKRVYVSFSCILSWMLSSIKLMTPEEAEAVEDSWDEIFFWLAESRDALKPHVDEARGRAK